MTKVLNPTGEKGNWKWKKHEFTVPTWETRVTKKGRDRRILKEEIKDWKREGGSFVKEVRILIFPGNSSKVELESNPCSLLFDSLFNLYDETFSGVLSDPEVESVISRNVTPYLTNSIHPEVKNVRSGRAIHKPCRRRLQREL